jgi:signal transduction histidine kinase
MGRCTTTEVRISSQQLMQVLLNLVTNAAQALDRTLIERLVQVEALDVPAGVQFSVRDTGQGMTPEQVAKAGRERFTTKAEGQGTGLGLTIVRRIVEGAGGELIYRSELGSGTTVTFTLPKA